MNKISKVLLIAALFYSAYVYSSVPGQVNFQGVLHDNNNQVVNGSVNFDFAIYDAITGGSLLWSESQNSVSVNAGIYNVALGSVVPLSKGILSSGTVYLEVTVDNEILSPRQRMLAVPYAILSEEAASVSGVSGVFIQQLFQNVDYDGQSIANDDPLEGVLDVDGDGLSNFIDADNDGDGILDDQEINNGTGVNQITPIITGIDNGSFGAIAPADQASIITITGNNFLAGFTIQVGAENPVPQNVTNTSFDVTVGTGQVAGVAAVTVTNANAEVATDVLYFYDRKVFVTSNVSANALSQPLSAADAFCNQAAANAGLTGNFVAWISDPANSVSAKDRLTAGGGPWVRVDGTLVALDIADLTDSSLAAPISFDEFGVETLFENVATNTLPSGDFDPDSCFGSNPGTGNVGRTDYTDGQWTKAGAGASCTSFRRYYCFEE